MTSFESTAQQTPAVARRFTPSIFAITSFLSALLIFMIQPLFTKMMLPKLGGTPSVWSVAMVVFQTALFIGYVYAHILASALTLRRAATVHIVFFIAVALTLPIGIAPGFSDPPEHGVALWLAALFFASIGLPFIALAASAPLLQHWLISTGHKQAANPYVLYAASNLGSFGALLAYPFIIEPALTLKTQIAIWSVGYCGLAALIVITAWFATARPITTTSLTINTEPRPTALRCLHWTALAAVPSGLVVAVTAHITTDLAAAPLLWVLPLALYLLTFVMVFRDRPLISHELIQRFLPYGIIPLAVSSPGGNKAFWFVMIALTLVVFIMVALACHGEAYRTRPHRSRLTEFYLWISFGGAIGGLFAGGIAPNIFNTTHEYPILLVGALLLLPGMFQGGWPKFLRDAGPGLAIAGLLAIVAATWDLPGSIAAKISKEVFLIIMVGMVATMLFSVPRLAKCFGLMAPTLLVTMLWQPESRAVVTTRSFFGVHQVIESQDRTHHILFHGTTIHGAEKIRDEASSSVLGNPLLGKPEPLTYYYFGGPISDAIEAARAARGQLRHVAAIGLGTGSLACHRHDGEHWTFFEIDPEVVRIAQNPKLFRFLSVCAPDVPISLGDARLTFSAAPKQYDVIVLDAFSSDAIPVHLLTREAFAGYVAQLAPQGVIVAHVSNRHMELASVVAAVGKTSGLTAYAKQDSITELGRDFRANALVVALARAASDLGDLPSRKGWYHIHDTNVVAWTDDYADLLGAIARKKFGKQSIKLIRKD